MTALTILNLANCDFAIITLLVAIDEGGRIVDPAHPMSDPGYLLYFFKNRKSQNGIYFYNENLHIVQFVPDTSEKQEAMSSTFLSSVYSKFLSSDFVGLAYLGCVVTSMIIDDNELVTAAKMAIDDFHEREPAMSYISLVPDIQSNASL